MRLLADVQITGHAEYIGCHAHTLRMMVMGKRGHHQHDGKQQ
jgi:hypothetical protein